jgi:hypothetical protein
MKKRQPKTRKTKRFCAKCGFREVYLDLATNDWCEECLWDYIKPDQAPITPPAAATEQKPANTGYVHPDKLIDKTMLLLGTRPFEHPYFRLAVDAQLGDSLIHFAAGSVVEKQLCDPRITYSVFCKLV